MARRHDGNDDVRTDDHVDWRSSTYVTSQSALDFVRAGLFEGGNAVDTCVHVCHMRGRERERRRSVALVNVKR